MPRRSIDLACPHQRAAQAGARSDTSTQLPRRLLTSSSGGLLCLIDECLKPLHSAIKWAHVEAFGGG